LDQRSNFPTIFALCCFTLLTEATGDGDAGDAQAAMQEALLQMRHFLQYEAEVERLMLWQEAAVQRLRIWQEELAVSKAANGALTSQHGHLKALLYFCDTREVFPSACSS
jgi:hypothetical protein